MPATLVDIDDADGDVVVTLPPSFNNEITIRNLLLNVNEHFSFGNCLEENDTYGIVASFVINFFNGEYAINLKV